MSRRVVSATAVGMLLLTSCSRNVAGPAATAPSSGPASPSAVSGDAATSGPPPEPGFTARPSTDSNALGAGTSAGGTVGGRRTGSRTGSTAAGGAVVLVAGPTLDARFSEYFGNFYSIPTTNCAVFRSTADLPATVRDVTAPRPFRLVTGCAPDDSLPSVGGCVGTRLPPAPTDVGCTIGVQLPSSVDRARNYTGSMTWSLSATCTAVHGVVCSRLGARRPSSTHPVEARWRFRVALRYCGGTDYAQEDGSPGGRGTSPTYGCSTTTATSGQPVPPGNGNTLQPEQPTLTPTPTGSSPDPAPATGGSAGVPSG